MSSPRREASYPRSPAAAARSAGLAWRSLARRPRGREGGLKPGVAAEASAGFASSRPARAESRQGATVPSGLGPGDGGNGGRRAPRASSDAVRVAIRGATSARRSVALASGATTAARIAAAWCVAELRIAARIQGSAASRSARSPSAAPALGIVPLAQAQGELEPYGCVGIVPEGEQRRAQRGVVAEPRLAQADRLAPDARVRIGQGRADQFGGEGAQAVERAEGLHPGLGPRAGLRQRRRAPARPAIAAVDQQALDVVAERAVGRVERRGQLGGRQAIEVRHGPRRVVLREDAIDPPLVGAGADVEGRQSLRADPARMLDHEAVHVDDPERAVRTGPDLDGPEPVVGRGEELGGLLVGSPVAGEGDAVGRRGPRGGPGYAPARR